MSESQVHHVIWPRRLHNAYPETKKLRHRKGLEVELHTDIHTELHRQVPVVPIPTLVLARAIDSEFYPVKNEPVETMINLMDAINEASMGRDRVTRGLGKVMMLAIEAQIPFLEEEFK